MAEASAFPAQKLSIRFETMSIKQLLQTDYIWITIWGFINHKSESTWKMASLLYVFSVFVRGCAASGHIVMPFWTAALILTSLSTSWPTWPSTGLFSTAGRCRRSAEGTAQGLHTNIPARTHKRLHLNTYKHGNTIVSPLVKRAPTKTSGIDQGLISPGGFTAVCF